METMVQDIGTPWQSFRAQTKRCQTSLLETIEDVMEWAVEYLGMPATLSNSMRSTDIACLERELEDSGASVEVIEQALTSRGNLLYTEVEGLCDVFEKELS